MTSLVKKFLGALALAAAGLAQAADITIAQVAPLSGVLATTGKQMVLGGKHLLRAHQRARAASTARRSRCWWPTTATRSTRPCA